nr:patatin-like phospholipase family protein [uncultured Faecalibacillus sp.]
MKYGLVLSGGGSKGAYESGCLKALQELGYHFDIVTGTSIGALNGLLVAQEDYQKLYELWDTLSLEKVLKHPIQFDFSIENLMNNSSNIGPFLKSYLDKKGADIEPLIQLIKGLYNGKKAKNSPIQYGLCTVAFPSMKPLEITIDEMSEDNIVEYAIASASCFPAFPIHYIDKQGYIDGGYYDNLPVSLALKMGAQKIIAIELNQEATHSYLLHRENITFIRPSKHLGGFLDFNREVLDQRIRLGYLDTLKTLKKLKGYRFAFYPEEIIQEITLAFYNQILNYEDQYNHHLLTISDETPILDLLKENTYLNYLQLEDYFILGLELYMSEHDYDDLKVYHFNEIIQDIKKQIKPDLREIERIDFKNIAQSFKNLTNHQILKSYLSYFINKKEEHLNYENLFLKEFVLAMFITCVLSYEIS